MALRSVALAQNATHTARLLPDPYVRFVNRWKREDLWEQLCHEGITIESMGLRPYK